MGQTATKYCDLCNTDHPLTAEYFAKNGNRLGICRLKRRAASKRRNVEQRAQVRKSARLYYLANSEILKTKQRERYYKNRSEILNRYREAARLRHQRTKHKKREAHYLRLESNVDYKIRCSLRTRLYHAVKTNQKSGSAVIDLGCSIPDFKKHIESLFYCNSITGQKMDWSSWSKEGWQLDHIKPLCSFDLSDPLQFKEAVHFSNIRPLWKVDHVEKSRYDRRAA